MGNHWRLYVAEKMMRYVGANVILMARQYAYYNGLNFILDYLTQNNYGNRIRVSNFLEVTIL